MNPDDAQRLVSRLLAQLAPEIPFAEVDPTGDLREEFDLDSIDFLSFVSALHRETGIDVPEHDYPLLGNVAACVTYLVEGA